MTLDTPVPQEVRHLSMVQVPSVRLRCLSGKRAQSLAIDQRSPAIEGLWRSDGQLHGQ